MTETTPPNPESAKEQRKTIVHELWRGNICIELTGHLNIFVGHKLEHITPAMLALKSGDRPEKVIWEAFPNWQTQHWEQTVPLTTPPTLTSPDGSHILLRSAQGESTRKIDLIKAFQDWMLAWKAEERAMACAEEDEFEVDEEDMAPDPVETPRPKPSRFGLGSVVVTAGVLFLVYDAFKIFIPADITKRESIGVLVSAHSSGDWGFPWLLETDRGLYPVDKALMLEKGVPLTLIALSNGRHAVCDERLVVCVRTVGESRRIALIADEK
ncbi:MAG: hypothetical protein Q8S92_04555 [Hydrogenophaga sp.]|uniref:hypothetical protein n=1 Tax=Hydrogenophaga sp. TaxID=1904254 RepID=UPI002734F27A|nr:hypothetical protein [Hydrogenophaga sp.]MDP3348252.1 hypothetical protein [Hydrogenophaga sp.]